MSCKLSLFSPSMLKISFHLRDPNADYEVRWCMLKLADLAVRGVEEPIPKVTIHLPPTPMIEVASPLPTLPITPSIKIIPKASKPQIKIGGRKPSIAPSTPTSAPTPTSTKLKLFPSNVGHKPPTPAVMEVVTPKQLPEFKPPPVLRLAPAPPKKERPLERAQANGMSLTDLKCCRTALKRLKNCKHATIFHQPVDPVRDRAPKSVVSFRFP